MWPWVKTAVSRRAGDHARTDSCTFAAWNTPLVSTTTSQAQRRRRVLDATLELAATGGFDAVQMRDVAAAADVALGTLYRYLSSKERLLLEAMVEQQEDLRRHLEAHPAPGATPASRVVN